MTGQSPSPNLRPAGCTRLATQDDLLAYLQDGMTIGIGGFGLDRKPMSLIRAIARSEVRNLTIHTFAGGLDVEMLVAAGKVAQVAASHVGLDHFGLAPRFRAARESGLLKFEEWSEWTQLAAWRAAAEHVPFTTLGLDARSELLRVNSRLRRMPCPFSGQQVVAIEAPAIDLALLHCEAAHPNGWALACGDPYLDTLLARAAKTVVLSTERLIDDLELQQRQRDVHLLGSYVDALLLDPLGALPGSCLPEYLIDFGRVRGYVDACSAGAQAPERFILPAHAAGHHGETWT
jgi:glutaconate CoA-transferase subunit A